jgi:hypothetical protein
VRIIVAALDLDGHTAGQGHVFQMHRKLVAQCIDIETGCATVHPQIEGQRVGLPPHRRRLQRQASQGGAQ